MNVLKAKSLDLNEQLKAEMVLEQKIDSVIPIKLNVSNKSGSATDIAVKNCFQELKKFYDDLEMSQNDGELPTLFPHLPSKFMLN